MTERILWLNAGGTIVSEPYINGNIKAPPHDVDTLPLPECERLLHAAMEKLGVLSCVDGFACHGYDWAYDRQHINKDSKEFTDADIAAIADLIQHTPHRLVLITHGTDCMNKNAGRLQTTLRELGVTDKTVLFTGAMVPLIMDPNYGFDALGNLDYAFGAIDSAPSGVHIVGRDAHTLRLGLHDPRKVHKAKDLSGSDLQLTFYDPDKGSYSRNYPRDHSTGGRGH